MKYSMRHLFMNCVFATGVLLRAGDLIAAETAKLPEPPVIDPGPPGGYFSPYGVQPDGEPKGQSRVGTITDGPDGEYIVDRLADEAVKFIESS